MEDPDVLTVEFEGSVYEFDANLFSLMARQLKTELGWAERASREWPEKAEFLARADLVTFARSMLTVNRIVRAALVKSPPQPPLPVELEKLDALTHQLYLLAIERREIT